MRTLLPAALLLLLHGAAAAQAADPDSMPRDGYRLPFADGHSFMVGQAPGGLLTTHATPGHWHAIDIAMPEGTPVVAARAGLVIETTGAHAGACDCVPAHGNMVRILHEDGTIAGYHHLAPGGVSVVPGDVVAAGQGIGYSGSTGHSSGPHLHFVVTRLVLAGGRLQEVSEPVLFHAGQPLRSFAARTGLVLSADYQEGSAMTEPLP